MASEGTAVDPPNDGRDPERSDTSMVYCTWCDKGINLTRGSDINWQNHIDSSKHIRNKAAVNGKRKLTSFFKKSTASIVGSLARRTLSPPSVQEFEATAPLSEAPSNDNEILSPLDPVTNDTSPDDNTLTVLNLIHHIEALEPSLPSHIPEASPDDLFSVFVQDPSEGISEPEKKAQDIFETKLNSLLHKVFQGANSETLAESIRRGEGGVLTFCSWVKSCVGTLKLPGALFEMQIRRVVAAMYLLYALHCNLATSNIELTLVCSGCSTPLESNHLETPHPTQPATVAVKESMRFRCQGINFPVPDGQTPYEAYPIMLHARVRPDLEWRVEFSPSKITIRAKKCRYFVTEKNTVCTQCSKLTETANGVLKGIEERNSIGPSTSIQHAYLTGNQLLALLERKNEKIDDLRLDGFNTARTLAQRGRHLEEYKRFMAAVAQRDIPRLKALVNTHLSRGASVFFIMEKLEQAVSSSYSPKSYTQAEYEETFLLLSLGGRSAAELAYRTKGLPSINTAREHAHAQKLVCSASFPKLNEVITNLEKCPHLQKPSLVREKGYSPVRGLQLQIDEIKSEPKFRWDSRTNMILGVCRDHSEKADLEFRSMVEATAVMEEVQEEKIHLAPEVSSCIYVYVSTTYLHLKY